MPKAAREVNFVKTDQGSFNPRRTEGLLVVDECTEGVHVTAEAWRVEEAECHARRFGKRPTDGGCAARIACGDTVLEDLEIAGGNRDGAEGVEGIGVAMTLKEWDDKTGLPVRRDDGVPQDEVGEREKQVAPPRKVNFGSRVGEVGGIRGRTRNAWKSAATSSLHEEGARNLPESKSQASDAKRRGMDRKNLTEKSEFQMVPPTRTCLVGWEGKAARGPAPLHVAVVG